MTLDQAVLRRTRRVKLLQTSSKFADMSRQLEEIGFTPNEQVTVLTRGFPSGGESGVGLNFALAGVLVA